MARNWETKGGAIIYETYKVLKEKGFRFKLTIIGCNPMWHEENIEIIEYLDKSNPKDLALLYQKYQEANFFLMPTRSIVLVLSMLKQQHSESHHSELMLEVLVR